MRRINKIMKRTVAALLILVLFTSCLLSGTFAKYVTRKESQVKGAKLEKFGVTVDMIVDDAKLRSVLGNDACAANLKSPTQAEKDAGKVWLKLSSDAQQKAGINTVTIHNLKLKPGDDLTDFVAFTIGGTANVKCKMTVDVDIEYDIENFHIPMDKAKEFGWPKNTECYAIPLGFPYNFSAEDGTLAEPDEAYPYESLACGDLIEYQLYHDRIRDTISANPANSAFKDTKVSFYYSNDKKECYFEKEFDVGSEVCILARGEDSYTTVTVTNMKYGVKWPFTAGKAVFRDYYSITNYGNIKLDEMDSYIAYEKQPTIDLSYTVRVEQIDPNAT